MAKWESIGHVTDDVTWPWKVKVVTQTSLVPSISKMAGDRALVTMERLYEMTNWELNSHVTDGVTWPWEVMVSFPQYA